MAYSTRGLGATHKELVDNTWTPETREVRKVRYHVAIHKSYFPKNLHPKGVNSYVEDWYVTVHSSTEAVNKIWEEHGNRILRSVNPSVKQISLHWGTKKIGELLGRQDPIVVWKKEEVK